MKISGNQVLIKKGELDRETLSKICLDLTVEYVGYKGATIVGSLYTITEEGVWVPRVYAASRYKIETVDMPDGKDIPIEHFEGKQYKLTDVQIKVGRELITNFFMPSMISGGRAGCICDLPCGVGKTYIGIGMLYKFRKKTIWFTVTDITVRQTIAAIERSLPNYIVKQYGDPGWKEADCICSTIHSFILQKSTFRQDADKSREYFQSIGMVIYDEIHTLGGGEYGKIFDILYPKIQFGLSATPYRTDLKHYNFVNKVGPVMHSNIAPPKFKGIVHRINYFNEETDEYRQWLTMENGNYNHIGTVRLISSDKHRYPLLKYLINSLPANENIIVYCNLIDEVLNVHHYLEESFENVEQLTGSSSEKKVMFALNNARILVGNSKLFTGLSEDRFTTLIIWSTLKKLITQAIGRIKRWRDGDLIWNDKTRTVMDICDIGTISSNQFESVRADAYREEGWLIKTHFAKHTENGDIFDGKLSYG
jgi:hypothetical protein